MTDEMKVNVPVTCDRTGRTSVYEMGLKEAQAHQDDALACSATAEDIASFLKGVPHPLPDLVVMFRGNLVILNRVVNKKNDATVLRLLHDLTQDDSFPKQETKPRANKEVKTPAKKVEKPGPADVTLLSQA